ncbi:MAG: hypothetical protein ACI8P0_006328, partial [Planctomycetaceae bacterium]
ESLRCFDTSAAVGSVNWWNWHVVKVKPAGSQKRTQKTGKNLRLEFFPDFQQRHSRLRGNDENCRSRCIPELISRLNPSSDIQNTLKTRMKNVAGITGST